MEKIPPSDEDKFVSLQKNQILKLIELNKDSKQEIKQFNIAFKPTALSNAPYDTQHKYRSFDLWSILNDYCKFVVAPEPHCNGNVHYHGLIIYINNKRKYYNSSLPALKSIAPRGLCISPVKDLSQCIDYMLKNAKDHVYMKDNYLTYNYIAKYVPRLPIPPEIKKIKRLISLDRKKKKWLIKVHNDKRKAAYQEYRRLKQELD